jgi:hypothetical protein
VGPGACFTQARALTELTTVTQAKARPAYWLEQLAQQVAGAVYGAGGELSAAKPEGRNPKPEGRPKREIRRRGAET